MDEAINYRNLLRAGWESGGSFAAFIRGLPPYMKEAGLMLPQSFEEEAFAAFGAMPPEDLSAFPTYMSMEPLLEALAVRTQKEHAVFPELYQSYIQSRHTKVVAKNAGQKLKNIRSSQKSAQAALKKASTALVKNKEEEEALRKKAESFSGAAMDDKETARMKKKQEKAGKDLQEIIEASPYAKEWQSLTDAASGKSTISGRTLDVMRTDMQDMMRRAALSENYKECLSALKSMTEALKKIASHADKDPRCDYEEAKRKRSAAEKAYLKAQEQLADIQKKMEEGVRQLTAEDLRPVTPETISLVKKSISLHHRPEFHSGRSAVQSCALPDRLLDESFSMLSSEEKGAIRTYILENAAHFRTRLAWRIRTGNHRSLDIAETCRLACRTDGIPMRLAFHKPKKSKAKLVMFLDVSGSCREASEMMLTFMHEMREVFPSGCDTYCFTNHLYDVSAIYRDSLDAESSVREILQAIPRSGAYSDYNRPLEEFVKHHMSSVTKETIILFMGDARNNKNPTGVDIVRTLARKARRVYWLNTETRDNWNTGDSIMRVYAPYMNVVHETVTVRNLLDFLENMQ